MAAVLDANVSIVDGFAFNAISWSRTVWDTIGMWSASAPTRLTAPRTGLYLLIGQMNIANGIVGDVGMCIQRNGTGTVNSTHIGFGEVQFGVNGNYFPAIQVVVISRADVVGDYWECKVEKRESSGSGPSRTIDKGATFFQAQYLGS